MYRGQEAQASLGRHIILSVSKIKVFKVVEENCLSLLFQHCKDKNTL